MHINVDKPNIKMAPHTLNHTRVVKEWVETVVKVHESVGLMAGGTSLVINPSEWPKPLNGVAQVAPCSTICHQKSLEKGENERNGSIYAQFGSIENRLAVNPL